MCQNNRSLPNIVIRDKACFSMDGTVNTHNVPMYALKGDKPDFTFQRNNSCQQVTEVECVAMVFFLDPTFLKEMVMGETTLKY